MDNPPIDEAGPEPTEVILDWDKPQVIYTQAAGQLEIVERCLASPRGIGGFYCAKEKGHPDIDHISPRYNSPTSIRWRD